MAALRDPSHPKDAVWIARGTGMPGSSGLTVVEVEAGRLLTSNDEKARRILASPTDDDLADILDYTDPKSRVIGEPVVVQAVNRDGFVILEMGCSRQMVDRGIEVASTYGTVRVTNLVEALCRRIRLCGVR